MRLKSFVLIERENRYLLIQEASAKWKGKWFLPGGGVKDDETLEAGVKREVREEAGCDIELTGVFFVKYHAGFFNRKVSVFYCGRMTGEKIKTEPDEESLDVKWFTYEELLLLPLRQNLKKLVEIYRSHTHFMAVEDFKLRDY